METIIDTEPNTGTDNPNTNNDDLNTDSDDLSDLLVRLYWPFADFRGQQLRKNYRLARQLV